MVITPLFMVPIITGPVFMLAGFIMVKYPPKKINLWYGYRTASSMQSQERWDFAQKFSGRAILKSGGILIIMACPGWLIKFNISETAGALIGVGIMLLFAIIPIIKTERALKKTFGSV